MKAEEIKLRIVGTRRLIMHAGRLADPLDPITKNLAKLTAKRAKTEADHQAISKAEWFGGLWLSDGMPCVPAEALMAVFVGAARTRSGGPEARAGLIVSSHARLRYDGPTDLDELWGEERFRLRVPVKLTRGSRTVRTRPCFDHWSVEFTASYLPTLLNRETVLETYAIGGFMKAIGDWRPQNGTFSVEEMK
jgi:hypothetical protein